MRSGLLERAAGRKSDVLDATQALREEEATLSTYAGQLLEAQASLAVAETEKNKVLSTFVADNIQKSGDLARQMDEAQQELVKAEKRLAATAIYAPSDSVIQASSITTTGQVVSAENEIMRIIPANLPLEIEVFFCKPGCGVRQARPAGRHQGRNVSVHPLWRSHGHCENGSTRRHPQSRRPGDGETGCPAVQERCARRECSTAAEPCLPRNDCSRYDRDKCRRSHAPAFTWDGGLGGNQDRNPADH